MADFERENVKIRLKPDMKLPGYDPEKQYTDSFLKGVRDIPKRGNTSFEDYVNVLRSQYPTLPRYDPHQFFSKYLADVRKALYKLVSTNKVATVKFILNQSNRTNGDLERIMANLIVQDRVTTLKLDVTNTGPVPMTVTTSDIEPKGSVAANIPITHIGPGKRIILEMTTQVSSVDLSGDPLYSPVVSVWFKPKKNGDYVFKYEPKAGVNNPEQLFAMATREVSLGGRTRRPRRGVASVIESVPAGLEGLEISGRDAEPTQEEVVDLESLLEGI